MTRAISIVLIAAMSLQTVGCSTWRPLARANKVSKDEKQPSMQEQVLARLTEGMIVRIGIREGTDAPIKVRVFECVIERIGRTSLTVTPYMSYLRRTSIGEFALQYTDIASIEYREDQGLSSFLSGFAIGVLFLVVVVSTAIPEILLD